MSLERIAKIKDMSERLTKILEGSGDWEGDAVLKQMAKPSPWCIRAAQGQRMVEVRGLEGVNTALSNGWEAVTVPAYIVQGADGTATQEDVSIQASGCWVCVMWAPAEAGELVPELTLGEFSALSASVRLFGRGKETISRRALDIDDDVFHSLVRKDLVEHKSIPSTTGGGFDAAFSMTGLGFKAWLKMQEQNDH